MAEWKKWRMETGDRKGFETVRPGDLSIVTLVKMDGRLGDCVTWG
jgi:hypothetical protein